MAEGLVPVKAEGLVPVKFSSWFSLSSPNWVSELRMYLSLVFTVKSPSGLGAEDVVASGLTVESQSGLWAESEVPVRSA